jgi:sulfide:quinone oxidoreductase
LTRGRFIAGAGIAAVAAGGGYYALSPGDAKSSAKASVLLAGAGAAGISIASRLRRALPNAQITIVDPATEHYYQPGFTLVAAGVFSPTEIVVPQRSLIPDGVRWVQDSVAALDPDAKRAETSAHGSIRYDFMVLCPDCR